MTKTKKIALVALLIGATATLLLPCIAFADTLEDFGGEEPYNYEIWADGREVYQIFFMEPASWQYPIERIQTHIAYSDSEESISNVIVSAEMHTYVDGEEGRELYAQAYGAVWGNAPTLTVIMYSDPPEYQDPIASFTLTLYDSSTVPELEAGYYAYDLTFSNISGEEYVDYNTYFNFTIRLSDPTVPGAGSYDEGYSEGYNDGIAAGQEAAYDKGYKDGKADGAKGAYDQGFLDGKAGAEGALSVPKSLFGTVFEILSTPILGFVSVADILLIVMMLGIIFFFLWLVRGG